MKSVDEQPLISVIVPVFKVEQYLDRCVESIVNQTYKNLEIILVDDGSPDNCPQMCDAWAEKDSRIKVIHKTNGGVSRARNDGMKVAAGEFIAFIDSDDWIADSFVEKLCFVALNNNCDIVECEYQICNGNDDSVDNSGEKVEFYTAEETILHNLCDDMFKDVVWNRIYRKNIAIAVEFLPDKRHEDVYWVYQVLAQSKRSAHISSSLYYYFQRSGSYMNDAYFSGRLAGVDAAEQRYEFVKNSFVKLIPTAQSRFIGMCMYHSQQLIKWKIEGYKSFFGDLHSKAKNVGCEWKTQNDLPEKQKMWLSLYLSCPKLTCRIRNFLKIGI